MTQVESSPVGRYYVWTRGDRLRVARESVASSHQAFSELTGISKNTIGRYEHADNGTRLNRAFLKIWADKTGFSIEWLETGGVPSDTTSVTRGHQSVAAAYQQERVAA